MRTAIIRSVAFSFVLLLATPLFGQGKTDVVVMTNGDRITCEIKGLSNGLLHISLEYVDGTVSINWPKVARLESKRTFIVKTETGLVYTGTLAVIEAAGEKPAMIEITEAADQRVEVESSRVVDVDTTAKSFRQRLNGDISFGMTYAKGNESRQYNLSSSVEYPTERWTAYARFNSTLTAHSGARSSERNQVDLGYERLLRRTNYFFAGALGIVQSSEQSISLQTTVGASVGHYFANTNRTRFAVAGGLAWQKTNYTAANSSLGTQNAFAGLVTTEVRWFRFKKTNLVIHAAFLPSISEPGRYYFKTNQSFYVKVLGDLSWNISFYGSWDNRPPAGLKGSDYGTSTGLGWTFGNR